MSFHVLLSDGSQTHWQTGTRAQSDIIIMAYNHISLGRAAVATNTIASVHFLSMSACADLYFYWSLH